MNQTTFPIESKPRTICATASVISVMLDTLKNEIVATARNVQEPNRLDRALTNIFSEAENPNQNSSSIQAARLLQGLEFAGSITDEEFRGFNGRVANIFALLSLD